MDHIVSGTPSNGEHPPQPERRVGRSAGTWLCAALALAIGGCARFEPDARISHPGADVLDQNAARAAISAYRRTRGLPTLVLDPALQTAAQDQADAMARAQRLDHDVAGSLAERTAAIGYVASYAVENVSVGHATFATAFSAWRRSDAHDRNLLEPHVTRMGIAATSTSNGKIWWALIMSN